VSVRCYGNEKGWREKGKSVILNHIMALAIQSFLKAISRASRSQTVRLRTCLQPIEVQRLESSHLQTSWIRFKYIHTSVQMLPLGSAHEFGSFLRWETARIKGSRVNHMCRGQGIKGTGVGAATVQWFKDSRAQGHALSRPALQVWLLNIRDRLGWYKDVTISLTWIIRTCPSIPGIEFVSRLISKAFFNTRGNRQITLHIRLLMWSPSFKIFW